MLFLHLLPLSAAPISVEDWGGRASLAAEEFRLTIVLLFRSFEGLKSSADTMGVVLFVTAWALVAAIPCQDRGLQAHFTVPRSGGFPWVGPVTALYDRVLDDSKRATRPSPWCARRAAVKVEDGAPNRGSRAGAGGSQPRSCCCRCLPIHPLAGSRSLAVARNGIRGGGGEESVGGGPVNVLSATAALRNERSIGGSGDRNRGSTRRNTGARGWG
jgi:hypothetical protein